MIPTVIDIGSVLTPKSFNKLATSSSRIKSMSRAFATWFPEYLCTSLKFEVLVQEVEPLNQGVIACE